MKCASQYNSFLSHGNRAGPFFQVVLAGPKKRSGKPVADQLSRLAELLSPAQNVAMAPGQRFPASIPALDHEPITTEIATAPLQQGRAVSGNTQEKQAITRPIGTAMTSPTIWHIARRRLGAKPAGSQLTITDRLYNIYII
jgi:hypothetical protein